MKKINIFLIVICFVGFLKVIPKWANAIVSDNSIIASCSNLNDGEELHLTIRQQIPKTTGRQGWLIAQKEVVWRASKTAIIIVDMWDKHKRWGAFERINVLAPRINTVVKEARSRGVLIIHAPSGTMEYYRTHPARLRAQEAPHVDPPKPTEHPDPPLPVDISDGFSDTEERDKLWSQQSPEISCQHSAIEIKDVDIISSEGWEVYNILMQHGIKNLIYMGVHTNICILDRSFGIKAMVGWGFNVVLARDLTDAMYDPFKRPYVSHEEGTRLVIEYIEKFWCPTITSDDLTT